MKVPQNSPQYKLRIPDELYRRIKLWADRNSRSINAEIIASLDEKYPSPPVGNEVNEKLAIAAQKVAVSWSAALKALGQKPEENQQLQALLSALDEAAR